jgi:hypothetical protein
MVFLFQNQPNGLEDVQVHISEDFPPNIRMEQTARCRISNSASLTLPFITKPVYHSERFLQLRSGQALGAKYLGFTLYGHYGRAMFFVAEFILRVPGFIGDEVPDGREWGACRSVHQNNNAVKIMKRYDT